MPAADPRDPVDNVPVAGQSRVRFARRFWPVFGLGALGVLTLPLGLAQMLTRRDTLPPELAAMPDLQLMLLALVNPLLLVAAGAVAGALLADRVGLRSHAAGTIRPIGGTQASDAPRLTLRREFPAAVAIGLAVGVVLVAIDAAWLPRTGEAGAAVRDAGVHGRWQGLVLGIGYGGLSEEVIVRWGLMTVIVWVVSRGAGGGPLPPAWCCWIGIVIAAIVFGIAHLPALAAVVPLTPPLVLRTILLNAIAGGVYGWLYWRRSLESAMAAHASTHVAFATAALV